MIKMNNWILGGEEGEFNCGAVFRLSNEDTSALRGEYDQWIFSISCGLMLVQTKQEIPVPDLHRQAHGICEKILDMLSVRLAEYNTLSNSRWEYLLYYIESDREVLSCCTVNDFPMTVTSRVIDLPDSNTKEITMTIAMLDTVDVDEEGAVYTDRQWNLIYRYYRFAVMSSNLYDAYRWMYLVFEQALQTLVPVKKNSEGKIIEKEGAWLQRALKTAAQRYPVFSREEEKNINLDDINGKVADFMEKQYKNTRCRLFHSKDRVPVLNEEIETKIFQDRYDELKSICGSLMQILGFLSVPYGVVTNDGFRSMMLHTWEGEKGFFCGETSDTLRGGLALSESQLVCLADEVQYMEVEPGIINIETAVNLKAEQECCYISYGLEQDGDPLMIAEYFKPVIIKGLCRLKVSLVHRLKNKGQFGKY